MLKLGLRIKFFLYSNTLIVVTMSLVTVLVVGGLLRTPFTTIAASQEPPASRNAAVVNASILRSARFIALRCRNPIAAAV